MIPDRERHQLKGIPASPGLAVGRVCFWNAPESLPRYSIEPEMVPAELDRLRGAIEASQQQLLVLKDKVARELGEDEASIFSSHHLLLNDPSFFARVEKKLREEGVNVEAAVEEVIEELAKTLTRLTDPYMRERADDYRDVGRRVLVSLLSYQQRCTLEEGELIILVARELMPSDTVHFQREHVGAFVTERGGVSSHAAILARSSKLPAVVGVPQAMTHLRAGTLVLVDGTQGLILLDPLPAEIAQARADRAQRLSAPGEVRGANPSRTRDGAEVRFSANLTREAEAQEAVAVNALGVGLLRTEFLFMDRGEFLDEEKQYRAYRHVVETLAPHPVTIRTLDLGEDKRFDFEQPLETVTPNYILGWRSLRLSLAYPEVFLAQLRAILRAAQHGQVRLLLPMVVGVEELRRVRILLEETHRTLLAQNVPHAASVPVGAMIETPAAAVVPEVILREADFLSVGTNDLVQYVLVADRSSERMQGYYRPTAPAILALLKGLAEAGRRARKDVSLCGEIAGDPLYLPLLLGLGFHNLSVAPVLLADLARTVTELSLSDCQALAQRCLVLGTADEVEAELKAFLARRVKNPRTA